MLKYHTIDVSCRAIPGEVCLVFNITGCTIKCPGCNEKTLWKDKGIELDFKELRNILNNYTPAVTCVCFMGGEHAPQEINNLARFVKLNFAGLRTAWYSGLDKIHEDIEYGNFNYLKTGAYEASKGALGTPNTNQRVFMVLEDCSLIDITEKYIRTEPDEYVSRVVEPVVEEPEMAEEPAEISSEMQEKADETEVLDSIESTNEEIEENTEEVKGDEDGLLMEI